MTSSFVRVIPHVFGRNRPTVINNMTLLKQVPVIRLITAIKILIRMFVQELDLVDALGDMVSLIVDPRRS